jgi:hypothetical protein
MDTSGHQFFEKSRPRIALITSAFALGYGGTGGYFGARRCCAAFLVPTNHAKQRENLRDRRFLRFPSCVSWASHLPISGTHIDYHYAFYRIIQPVRDRIVTDDFDLPGLERGILIGIVAFSPRTVPQAVNELHDLSSLRATFRHDFEQINIQINLVGIHRVYSASKRFSNSSGVNQCDGSWSPARAFKVAWYAISPRCRR